MKKVDLTKLVKKAVAQACDCGPSHSCGGY